MNNIEKDKCLREREDECKRLKKSLREKDNEIMKLKSEIDIFNCQFQALPDRLRELISTKNEHDGFMNVRRSEEDSLDSYLSSLKLMSMLRNFRENMKTTVNYDRRIISEQIEKIAYLENEILSLHQVISNFALSLRNISQKNKETAEMLLVSKQDDEKVNSRNRQYSTDSSENFSNISDMINRFNDSPQGSLQGKSSPRKNYRNGEHISQDIILNSNTSIIDYSNRGAGRTLQCPVCERSEWSSFNELQQHCFSCGSIAQEEETESCPLCKKRFPKTEINEHTNRHFEDSACVY